MIDKLKDTVASVGNKLNPKAISKVELEDQIRLASQGKSGGRLSYNLQFFGGTSNKSQGTLIKGTSIYGERSYYSQGKLIREGVDPSTLKVGEQQMLDPRRLDWQIC